MMRILPIILLSGTAMAAISQTPSQNPPRPDSTRPPTGQESQDKTGQDKTQDPTRATSPSSTGSPEAKQTDGFLATWLVVGNNNEVALAQLAQTKATDPEVKQFAQKMIEDHKQMAQKLQPFASSVSGTATGALDKPAAGSPQNASFERMGGFDHVGLIQDLGQQCLQSAKRELEQKQGAEFDRCFMGMAVGAHMKANDMLTVFQQHASSSLKPVLSEGQKTVATHLQHAKDLAKKMETKVSATAK
jgi:predicted outer membrane protein